MKKENFLKFTKEGIYNNSEVRSPKSELGHRNSKLLLMLINYHNRTFRAISNSENGEVSSATIFKYFQEKTVFSGEYAGGNIIKGNIIGKVNSDNSLTFSYQHIDPKGNILTGRCHSTPEMMTNGKIRLHEKWQWTCRDFSQGTSVIEEI